MVLDFCIDQVKLLNEVMGYKTYFIPSTKPESGKI